MFSHAEPDKISDNSASFFSQASPQADTDKQAYFESKLAVALMKHPQENTVAFQVSQAIVRLIEKERNTISTLFKSKKDLLNKFKDSIYGKTFLGLFFFDKPKDNLSDILYDVLSILKDEKSILRYVLPLHSAIGYYVVQNLEVARENKNLTYAQLHKKAYVTDSTEDYNKISLKNILIQSKEVSSIWYGILPPQSPYARFIENSYEEHERAADQYRINRDKDLPKIIEVFKDGRVPLVAGPSRHTLNALASAYALILDKPEQFKEYVGLYAGYLILSGHHSFHEVIIIAGFKNFDALYEVNKYLSYLPESFKQSPAFINLIEDENCSKFLLPEEISIDPAEALKLRL
jgi:hypothetical protein